MRKLYKLKHWYSLEDTAERLTLTLSETVNVKDVLQLAVEGHLKLSWYMRHVAAIQVEYGERTIQPMPKFSEQKKPIVLLGFHEVKGQESVTMLNGPHHVLLDHCGALSDYLLAHITNTGGELLSLDGYYVQDNEGVTWNIMECFDDAFLKDRDPEKKRKLYDAANYFPSGVWPEISELGFTKKDLETFENKFLQKEEKEISPREKTTYLNIIGALLGILLGKSSNGNPYSKFNNQQAIIDAIHANYSNKNGLSKRNLEAKFAQAQQTFKNSQTDE
jgi:hypothetical protein